MTTSDRLDHPVTAWLEEAAAMRAPDDLLPLVIDRAAHTRRRPGWATTGRWISMETRAQLGAVPRSAIMLVTLGLLTVLAAGAIALGAGSSSALPPTGPAANGLIAYASDGDIWVVNPDGSGRRQLTIGPADDHTAAWSRDGTRLAYWSVEPSGRPASLVVVEADGSDPVTVFSEERGRTSLPVDWSPDGTQIAFTPCPDVVCGDFFVVAADGTASTMVGGPAFAAHTLAWSPDGTTIALGGRHAGDPIGVYLMAPDGSAVRRISQATTLEGFVTVGWSPDSARILSHAGSEESGPDIWTIAADGSGETNLTEGAAAGFLPRWSPDGAWVAFRDGETIFLVPSDGGEVRILGNAQDFAWSPDATALALEGIGDVRIFDVLSGDVLSEMADVPGVDSWQRLAP